jgi:putative NIF3 family GTP cyclohydrolase 1 type 2
MKVKELIKRVEELSGHPLTGEEKILHGSPETEITGVTVCWMTTPEAITAAGEKGDNFIICHENLYFPYDMADYRKNNPTWPEWQTNTQRRALLEKYGITVLRLHSTPDRFCIFDDFAKWFDLGAPVFEEGVVKVYEIEETTLEDMLKKVKEQTGMDHLRYTAPKGLDQKVSRIGLPWGGVGLFVNVSYQQRLIEQGCNLFIAGESDNMGFRFSAECGIPMIETSHEISENPGLNTFTRALAAKMPDIKFSFFQNECVWESF